MRSQGISQFYLHTPRLSANGMNHTCICSLIRSWYSFTNPVRMEGWVVPLLTLLYSGFVREQCYTWDFQLCQWKEHFVMWTFQADTCSVEDCGAMNAGTECASSCRADVIEKRCGCMPFWLTTSWKGQCCDWLMQWLIGSRHRSV